MNEFAQLRQKAGLSIAEAAETIGWSASTVYRWDRGEQTPRRAAIDTLRRVIADRVADEPAEAGFSFIDLFAGIGGMRRGFEGIGGRCIYTSEWNSWSQTTYQANFPGDSHPIAGDITQVSAEEIPAHDVLVAGFPCQPFSIAGVSKKNALGRPHGFRCDAQGTLFFDVARILEHHRPKAFLLENVKNLVSHDKGNTFRVIQHTLKEELGYHVSVRVIDAGRFVPQHRERIFIVGMRDSTGFTLDDLPLPSPQSGPVLRSILHPEDGTEEINEFTQAYHRRAKGEGAAKVHAHRTSVDVPAELRAQAPGEGQRLRLWSRGSQRRRAHAIRALLQGRLGNPREAEGQGTAPADAARVRAADGLR